MCGLVGRDVQIEVNNRALFLRVVCDFLSSMYMSAMGEWVQIDKKYV